MIRLILITLMLTSCSTISPEVQEIVDCANRDCHRNEMIDLLNPIYKAHSKRLLTKDIEA